jgi:hypothetical protein
MDTPSNEAISGGGLASSPGGSGAPANRSTRPGHLGMNSEGP